METIRLNLIRFEQCKCFCYLTEVQLLNNSMRDKKKSICFSFNCNHSNPIYIFIALMMTVYMCVCDNFNELRKLYFRTWISNA